MRLTITGSGGFRRTPRPGCDCAVCQEARNNGTQRLGSSMFIHDENILFDTPEEIAAELENAGIQKINHLFFTHWHPDHTLGARIIEVMNTKWSENMEWRMTAKHKTQVYMPKLVHSEIMERFGPFFDFWGFIGIAEVHELEGAAQCGNIKVEPVVMKSMHRTVTHSTVYIISSNGKKVVYAPCDITPFPQNEKFHNCDTMILQIGWYGPRMAERAENGPHCEISMDEIISIAKTYQPAKIILTHIGDDSELLEADMKALEEKYAQFNIQFAYDGMELDI
jgi:phosphoribosyl 1,2-cyclic phosphate phosphodiesterase